MIVTPRIIDAVAIRADGSSSPPASRIDTFSMRMSLRVGRARSAALGQRPPRGEDPRRVGVPVGADRCPTDRASRPRSRCGSACRLAWIRRYGPFPLFGVDPSIAIAGHVLGQGTAGSPRCCVLAREVRRQAAVCSVMSSAQHDRAPTRKVPLCSSTVPPPRAAHASTAR